MELDYRFLNERQNIANNIRIFFVKCSHLVHFNFAIYNFLLNFVKINSQFYNDFE